MNDREMLDKDDYALIKSCGLRCRGRGQWPSLRRYRVGFMPWYLDDEDRDLLGTAMRAVCRIAKARFSRPGRPAEGRENSRAKPC